MKTSYGRRWYKPREIAQLGLIKNTMNSNSESSNYDFIINLITSGRLRHKNVGMASQARYLVAEDEIERYHNTVSKLQ